MISEEQGIEPIISTAKDDDKAFLGHPKGLGFLAFTEAWERFSYYGMQSLLVLYMAKQLLLPGHVENIAFFASFSKLYGNLDPKAMASAIFGTYAAMVYFTPVFGGLIADRLIGKTKAVTLGASLMAIGHFLMAFEVSFLFALLCLIIGSGLFKGNLAGQIGNLYKPEDLRRADAFQIYYLAINAGVIAAPLIAGTLGEKIGWHWGFGAAGVGMVIGLMIYLSGLKYLPKDVVEQKQAAIIVETPKLSGEDMLMMGILVLLVPVIAIGLLPNQEIFNAYLLWGDAQFDLKFNGEQLPTTWLITLDSIVSVSFLALVALFFRWYGTKWKEPDELTKLILGTAIGVGGMLCLYIAAATQPEGGKIGLFWPVAFHFVNSIGFAMVVPIGMALFVRLAPQHLSGTAAGLYTLSFFASNAVVGYVGGLLDKMPTTQFWLLHAAAAGFASMVFIVLKLTIGKRIAGRAI